MVERPVPGFNGKEFLKDCVPRGVKVLYRSAKRRVLYGRSEREKELLKKYKRGF